MQQNKRDNKRTHTSEEMILKASSKHELINEQTMVILTAIPDQLDKIRMPKLSKKVDLSKPLTVTLKPLFVKYFDSNRQRLKSNTNILINVALVNSSKTTLTKYIIRSEAFSNCLQLKKSKCNYMSIQYSILSKIL